MAENNAEPTAPKAGALPDCATPRLAFLRVLALSGAADNPPKWHETGISVTKSATILPRQVPASCLALLLLAACSAPQGNGDTVRAACHDAQPFLQAAALAKPSAATDLLRLCAGEAGSPEQVRQQTEVLIQALYSPI